MKLITALPRTGKSTIIMRLIEKVGRDNCIGFYSEEIIIDNERVGFRVLTLNGRCEVFAHVDLNSEIKCGRYGVDIAVLEDVFAGELEKAIADTSGKLIVIDEIGPMQIFSEKFKKQLTLLADSGKEVIGTIFHNSDPWIDEFKQRKNIELIQLTMENRDYLSYKLIAEIRKVTIMESETAMNNTTSMNNATSIKIGNEEYLFIKEYKDNDVYRSDLNRLTQQNFGFSFEDWYRLGFWGDRYRPYSFVHKEQVIANVSVNPIDFLVDGQIYKTLQIGTVMTDNNYRKKGLSREIFNIIMEEYEGKVDLMYLYANDSVLEFYPKFGFTIAEEYTYSKQYEKRESKYTFSKLNGRLHEDRELILRLVQTSLPAAKYTMINNPGLAMFYLTSFMADSIYYCEELDLAAVAEFEDDGMFLADIYGSKEFDLDEVINALIDQASMKVKLGFTPRKTDSFHCELHKKEDTTFFVKGNNFVDKGRFPILSHA